MTVPANGNRTIVAESLSIGTTGKLDLNDNELIVDYSGSPAGQLAAVQALINAARNGGTWTGTAASPAPPRRTRVPKTRRSARWKRPSSKRSTAPNATFTGQAIDSTAVLVKYTYYGDTDFNGVVNFDDYSRTDAGFNGDRPAGSTATSTATAS